MNLEKASRLHRYAAIMAGIFFVAGFIKASFYEGEAGVAAVVWFLGLSLYLPFYLLRSEFTGVIYLPRGGEFFKESELIGFRFVQGLYFFIALVFFLFSVRELT